MTFRESSSRSSFLFEHDPFPKTAAHFSGSCSSRRDILRPVGEIAGVELAFDITEARIDVGRVGRADPRFALVLRHEIDVGAAGREWPGGGPVLARPGEVAMVFLR